MGLERDGYLHARGRGGSGARRSRGDRRRALGRDAWAAAMAAAEKRFPPGNPHGVFAFGIDQTTAQGLPGPLGLVVHVERKMHRPPARVPALRVDGITVVPDVVGSGRTAVAGQGFEPVFTGLHPGAAIVTGASRPQVGAVACILARDDRPVFLITAGHLFPQRAGGMPVGSAPADWDGPPEPIGTLQQNLLDGSPGADADQPPIDASLIELNADGVKLARRTRSRWTLGSIMKLATIDGTPSQAFRWRGGQFALARPASTLPRTVHFRGHVRDFTVRDVVSTSPSTTADGDSGTILVEAAARRRAIGVCVGEFAHESIFEPLDKVLRGFGAAVAGCRIWPNPT